MSKIPGRTPSGVEADHRHGELRKPGDRASQPGQGGSVDPPNEGHANPRRADRPAGPLNDQADRRDLDPLRYHDLPPLGRDEP